MEYIASLAFAASIVSPVLILVRSRNARRNAPPRPATLVRHRD